MTSLSRPRVEFISTILQTVLNLGLLSLGLILVVFLGKETLHLADVLFAPEQTSKYELVEGLVVYFLYFEFIALIVKYFQSGFHFPLRYFVYIGITAIVRLIIVDHKAPMDVLIYSAAILLLVITLWLCNSKRLKRVKDNTPQSGCGVLQVRITAQRQAGFSLRRVPTVLQVLPAFCLWFPAQTST